LRNRFLFPLYYLGLGLVGAILSFAPRQAMAETPAATPSPSDESLYRFQSDTAWGPLNVLVRNLNGSFKVEVKSDSIALGWILKEESDNRTISKGGLSPETQFQFGVNQPFQGPYRLTVYLDSDHEEVPASIRLSIKNGNKGENPGADSLDDYQENPDHPYNAMVKNFYEQAVVSYGKGDNLHALELLKKAEELDPSQPQVEALVQKIQGPSDASSNGPLDQVRDALKKGNQEEALAKLEDYLDEHPDDEDALELKDQIEGKSGSVNALQNALAKAKEEEQTGETSQAIKWYKKALSLDPQNEEATAALSRLNTATKHSAGKKKPHLTDADAQAQADQSYNLGLESYRKDDYASAKRFWEETLQILPTHLQARQNLDRLKTEHPELK
jgi:tetratricopeptide (TPR) repeat protein